ncbi:hypothetical protein [Ralstonia sp. GX3-BWBA]|uniref:hypothetical protein n=1 Tax=Ralstonia sp. GX3-BWBA TaxID=2219865 RepID=UPI0013A6C21C|nr:hypothetical protein [Ralstonia sp. GX3-BWBA]
MLRIGCAAALGLLTVLTGCGPKSVSGGYLGKTPGTVVWLQLVETPDKHITGQLNTSTIDKDGKLLYITAPVTGAVDGQSISLSVKRDVLLAATVQLGGTVNGDTLNLRGGPTGDEVILHRAKDDEFAADKQELAEQSQRFLAAKAEAEQRAETARREKQQLDEVRSLTQSVNRMNADLPRRVAQLLTAEKAYADITTKMRGLVRRQQELAGNPGAFVARTQVVVNLNQNLVNSNQAHISAGWAAQSLRTDIKPVIDRLTTAEQTCHRAGAAGSSANEACQALLAVAPAADLNAQAANSAIARVEAAYDRERSQQEELFRTAQELQ